MVTNNSCNYQPIQYNVQSGGANGTLNNIDPATAGFVLTSNGISAQPTFLAPIGSLVLVQTQNVSNVADVIFTNLSSYNVYFLTITAAAPVNSNATLEMLVSQDNGSSYLSSGYQNGFNYYAYNSAVGVNVNSSTYVPITTGMGASATLSAQFYLLNANIGLGFYIQGFGTWADNTLGYISAYYTGTAASGVNAIKFAYSSGNISNGIFSLYGLSS